MCNKEDSFINGLLDTNRGYNYYVNWDNINEYDKYKVELSAMDVLIRVQQNTFKEEFINLLSKVNVNFISIEL